MTKWINNLRLAWKTPRWRRALIIAGVSDVLGFGVALFPPAQWVLDAITALALLVVLGYRWKLLIALAVEVVPALQLFPAWILVVGAMAATETQNSSNKNYTQ